MIPLLAVALLAGPEPALSSGAARYQVVIAGAVVGVAELSVGCGADASCTLRWESRLRLPEAAGGNLHTRRIAATVDRGGALLGPPEVEIDGVRRPGQGGRGAVPASAAELVLSARGGGCVEVVDEETGRAGRACARRDEGRLLVQVLGVAEEITSGEDGFPRRVDIPAQQTCFQRDAAAQVPAEAPPLEVRVPGPPEGRTPRRFCGRAPDAPAPEVDQALPAPRPDGTSCRAQAAAYAAAARRRGFPARIAVGVAHDGEGFVWHAWVEVRTARGWLAVDPALGQLPAQAPRFTIARHGGDARSVDRAGRRILECWGRASVE